MRKTSVRDLHIRTSKLVKEAASRAVMVLERRGEPVAELRPLTTRKLKPKLPNMTRFWTRFPKVIGDNRAFLGRRSLSVYLDSAYLAKFFVNERDSDALRALIRRADSLVTSSWVLGEVTCGVWTLVPVSESRLKRMASLVSAASVEIYLRAGDAVHLTTARDIGEAEIWTNSIFSINGFNSHRAGSG